MDDPPLQKIAISGPTLASLIQRFSTSPSAIRGLLFGHVTHLPTTPSDDSPSTVPTLLATVTGFLCSPSFHESSGDVIPSALHPHSSVLGWFSARRRSALRPSMRDFSVTSSLSSLSKFSTSIDNSNLNLKSNSPEQPSLFPPCVFLLLASPPFDNASSSHVHTHEYRAFQFRTGAQWFEPRSLDVVNIGPAFRGHYGAFIPTSSLPALDRGLCGSPMDDGGDERLARMKQAANDQRELDGCVEGFEVGKLSRMVGSDARSYTEGLEELYKKMLVKIQNLTSLVDESSAMVLEQENHNRKLKHKIFRSAAASE
ncbi:hypothetical protein VIGAN_09095500 [Vigna angularis var. angularis]|uniref:Uncharacterized protein n=1 Tax=Vigna angularis var. angularis TaxID=157739 RepID=A0A0S3SXJ0_PHAAN|nr:uncharacterized protein LOC108347413 isoform X2 [Vigna angularis]XP_017442123.1 uncharacterized protein LOC108347413 isoform X2 [Vigna angularis]XP_052724502.1 uncharacterized protein LOC108347413 isoform X2 [Vigna angularis]BAT97497.1 hypothetical protein VIGAN_09095500 [Vigna angularis var. angularis]